MELTLMSLAATTASCALSYLQKDGLDTQTQQAWTEWFAWAVIAIVAHLPGRRAPIQLSRDDKEAQPVLAWSKPGISVPATIIAVPFAISSSISIYIPQRNLQWSLVSIASDVFEVAEPDNDSHSSTSSRSLIFTSKDTPSPEAVRLVESHRPAEERKHSCLSADAQHMWLQPY